MPWHAILDKLITMTNIDLVRHGYEAFRSGNHSAVLELLSPDIEILQSPLLPWGGHHRGLDGAKFFFGCIAEHIDGLPEVSDVFEAGDDVVVSGRLRAVARKTGAWFDIPIVHVWTISNGKAIRFQAYIETAPVLKALGR